MNPKPAFEAAHNCVCAYPDIPILEFYKGYFEAVYIILHPFTPFDEQITPNKPVSWKEFIELAGFNDINQLDIALRNFIRGLNAKWENETDVEALQLILEKYNLSIPFEGAFQDVLQQDMLISLQEQGHDYIFLADEFGFERKVAYIPDIIEKKEEVPITGGAARNWYTNENEILYTTHWDSHFTLLCSNKETIKNILKKHPFEGFYCDSSTEIYWSLKNTPIA